MTSAGFTGLFFVDRKSPVTGGSSIALLIVITDHELIANRQSIANYLGITNRFTHNKPQII